MPFLRLLGLLFALIPCLLTAGTSDFGTGWRFHLGEQSSGAAPELDDSGWEQVALPHTARLEALVTNRKNAQQWEGVCWYRKTFTPPSEATGQQVLLRFEGAMNTAKVFVNGALVLEHADGYLPFVVDLSGFAKHSGPLTIAVRLDNRHDPVTGPKPLSLLDFHLYHGLYRSVALIIRPPLHITDEILENKPASGGVLVSFPEVREDRAGVLARIHIRNTTPRFARFALRCTLREPDGAPVASADLPGLGLAAGADGSFSSLLNVPQPRLWSPQSPNLYHLEVELLSNGRVLDTWRERIGIRRVELARGGLLINGKKLFLRGVNRHQEAPYVGNAVPDDAQYRDAYRIKAAGFDYVRLSHYPQSPAFMDACDELGLVVMNSILGWQFDPGTPAFHANRIQAAHTLVRRDRNHACAIFWELSINETHMSPGFIAALNAAGHEELPGDQFFTAGWMKGYDVKVSARQAGSTREFRDAAFPCIVSEYGDWEYYAGNAGLNQEEWKNLKKEDRNSRQLRGDGELRLLQQATNLQEAHNENLQTQAMGDGYWVMYDYNRGYADDLEASGLMDIFRLPKFSHYFFQSQRSPAERLPAGLGGPMVFIANYWTPKSPLEVRVFSNCDEVELLLNNRVIARQKPDRTQNCERLPHPPFTFRVPEFVPGTLRARAYLGQRLVAEHAITSPGTAAQLQVEVDSSGRPVTADGDLVYVHARVVDRDRNLLPDATPLVTFSTDDTAELIGENPVRAEAGIASILVKTKKGGALRLHARTPDSLEGSLSLPLGAEAGKADRSPIAH